MIFNFEDHIEISSTLGYLDWWYEMGWNIMVNNGTPLFGFANNG